MEKAMTDHLRERARQQLEALTVDGRCAAIEEARWIGYMAANRALEALSKVRERPKSTRTAGVAICGPYRNGKTMVADKFLTTATMQIRPPTITSFPLSLRDWSS